MDCVVAFGTNAQALAYIGCSKRTLEHHLATAYRRMEKAGVVFDGEKRTQAMITWMNYWWNEGK